MSTILNAVTPNSLKPSWLCGTEPTLAAAVDQIEQGIGTLVHLGKDRIYAVVKLTSAESGIKRVHQVITDNAELIFWALAAINLYQHWALFSIGVVTGLAIAGAGEKLGLLTKSVQILKTKTAVTDYNYLSGALLFVLAPWLSSLQSGITAGNYLGNPTPKSPSTWTDMLPWMKG